MRHHPNCQIVEGSAIDGKVMCKVIISILDFWVQPMTTKDCTATCEPPMIASSD
jgi:hypothetical protein